MTAQLVRVDLANGSSWYFHSDTTTEERVDLMLSYIHGTFGSIRLRPGDGHHMSHDGRHELFQTLTPEIDFAIGLLEETP
ncbi:hypothetical protein VRRI112168_05180 [Vreelandella rituensis]|uniref:Uncharacterized protein n=1 Tax=Vreelandella rituensis TaxID=2282306 RepID=A0A368U791_9GAMM|nr:hypothetical protein [Halomonas rituensis]RCV92366.1 hypothetical protein DU506_08135 [Halomonas rituensis]